MFLKFTKPVVVAGVAYRDGQTVPLAEIPHGSVRSIVRGGQAVVIDEMPKSAEPAQAEPAQIESFESPKPASKKAPK